MFEAGPAWRGTRLAPGLIVLTALILSGCSRGDMLQKVTLPEDRSLCLKVIADLQAGPQGDADIAAHLSPELRAGLAPVLPKMRALMPAGAPPSSRLVDASFTATTGGGHTSRDGYLAYEVDGGGQRALLRFEIVRTDGAAAIKTFYINPLSVPAEQIGAFTLDHKTVGQYLVLALSILSFGVIVVSEIVLFRTRPLRRKWLWVVGCLFGYGQIGVDWASGAWSFSPLYLQLFGAFALKAGLLSPWRLGFGIPVVSMIFLVRRRRLVSAASPGEGEKATNAF